MPKKGCIWRSYPRYQQFASRKTDLQTDLQKSIVLGAKSLVQRGSKRAIGNLGCQSPYAGVSAGILIKPRTVFAIAKKQGTHGPECYGVPKRPEVRVDMEKPLGTAAARGCGFSVAKRPMWSSPPWARVLGQQLRHKIHYSAAHTTAAQPPARVINGYAEATRKHMSPELWFGALPGRGAKVGFDAAVQAHRRVEGNSPLSPMIGV